MKDKADIIFLLQTYSTPEVENVWKSRWRGEVFFNHGAEHSIDVLTLIKEGLDCQLEVCKQDELGRYVTLKGLVQGNLLFLLRIRPTSDVFLW